LQAWEYPQLRIRIIFEDRTGFGRWVFVGNSAGLVQTALQRRNTR